MDVLYLWEQTSEYFEKIFGKGVVPKSITIEITDEPVTWDIDTYFCSHFAASSAA